MSQASQCNGRRTRKEIDMNKIIVFLSTAVLIFGISGGASASLVDQGNGTIYDDAGDVYWYKDLSVFRDKTYQEQLDLIEAIPGSNFHLASYAEMDALFSQYSATEIGNAFTRSGQHPSGYGTQHYDWYGRYESTADADPYHYVAQVWHETKQDVWDRNPLEFLETADSVRDWFGAWVTSNTALVPVPAALWLLGSGLIGLAALRRKIKM